MGMIAKGNMGAWQSFGGAGSLEGMLVCLQVLGAIRKQQVN